MTSLSDLPTPVLLLEEARMMRNIERMQHRMDALGVRFRPHVKTSKCVQVARRQQAAGASAITVSTLKEAEQFFAAGFDDILYAVALAPARLGQALDLRRRGCRLGVLVDSVEAAAAVAAAVRDSGVGLDCLIEIDTDGHRAGVRPDEPRLIEIGRILHAVGALAGVLAHAGSSYELSAPEPLAALAEQERAACVAGAEHLRAAGLPCRTVSVGSTPTALSARSLAGVTEVRAGVYVFFDLVMANVGVCTIDDLALSVLATVIGHQPDKGWILVDAGWMAMSRDRGTQAQPTDHGYGAICAADGTLLPELWMQGANQEHGIVCRRDGQSIDDIVARHPIGSQLRVLPNHACATAAQHPAYAVLQADGGIVCWERFYGW